MKQESFLIDRLLVVGIGLIGGSILKATRARGVARFRLGLDRDPLTMGKALKMRLIQEGSSSLQPLPPGRNLVVLATHLDNIFLVAEELLPYVGPGTVVTDVSSVKAPVVEKLSPLFNQEGIPFVGGHPIAGTERSGLENSLAGLFEGAPVVLTPEENTAPGALSLVKRFWQAMGARIEEMDPLHHDLVFAAVSHLPHAVTYALVKTLGDAEGELGDLLRYSGGGFRDFTRIAASSARMWREIFRLNDRNLLTFIKHFSRTLEILKAHIEKGEWERLEGFLEEASWLRKGLG